MGGKAPIGHTTPRAACRFLLLGPVVFRRCHIVGALGLHGPVEHRSPQGSQAVYHADRVVLLDRPVEHPGVR